jgi:hypothetical protein
MLTDGGVLTRIEGEGMPEAWKDVFGLSEDRGLKP